MDLIARRQGQFNLIDTGHINDEAGRNRGDIAPTAATIGYVAECLILKPHSASGLIDRLESLALIERRRSSEDRRQAQVFLTEKADKLLAKLSATHREEIRRLRPMLTALLASIGD